MGVSLFLDSSVNYSCEGMGAVYLVVRGVFSLPNIDMCLVAAQRTAYCVYIHPSLRVSPPPHPASLSLDTPHLSTSLYHFYRGVGGLHMRRRY